ncbi:MAG: hypothetical protein E6G07_05240 [Actinobacteria bacterium]|nr:MAG: hypothetical protein E6G07_05240 [Actinomycetota bacterium]
MRIGSCVAIIATAAVAAGCGGSAGSASRRPFGPNSPWNAPLARSAPVDPRSPTMVTDLIRQIAQYGVWINTTSYSVPIYTVRKGQKPVHIHLDIPGRDHAWNNPMFTNLLDGAVLQRQLDAVPVPPNARGAGGTDHSLVVWQPSTDTAWELWEARDLPRDPLRWPDPTPGWHAMWGARVDHVSTSSGVIPAPFGATASGLSLLGGLIRIHELEAGHIDHAIAIGIPQPTGGRFVPPATRTDGRHPEMPVPEGTRFRLDPRLDMNALHLPPVAKMIALAAQRYGLIVRDTAGSVVVFAEDPTPTGSNPYPRLFGGLSPGQIMIRFPWSRLQVIAPGKAA